MFVRRIAAAVLIVLSAAAHGGGRGLWTDLAPMTLPRQEVGAARIGDRVYVCGGIILGGPSRATNTVEVYTVSGNDWDPGPLMPLALDHLAVSALDGYVYVMGGFTRNALGAGISMAESFRLADGAAEWEPIAPMPESRAGHWSVAHRGKIYVVGGVQTGVGVRASVLIYDPALDEWTAGAADMPTPREHLNAVSAGPYIYVLGGRAGGVSYTALERYDPVHDEWVIMTPMVNARAAMVMAPWGSKIYCAGGETPMLFAVNEVYDILTDTWSLDTEMAIPRHGIAAVTLESGVFAPAGGVVQGFTPTNAADLFVPAGSAADIGGGPGVNAIDVQLAINALLGLDTGPVNADIDADGAVTAADVQRAINAALGIG